MSLNINPPSGGNDRSSFATAVLQGLGAPVTQENVNFMLAWMQREGTKAAFNPLATTLDYGGGSGFNSVGVKNYPSFQVGVEATVRTLLYSGYDDIVSGLRSGAGAWNASHGLSRWSGGGYSSLAGGGENAAIGTGTSGATYGAGDSQATAAPAAVDPVDFARQHYGYLAAYLDDPEIGPILRYAAANGSDLETLQGALYNTNWWKTHSDSMRTWDALVATDHATADARIDSQIRVITQLESELGIGAINRDRMLQIASDSLRMGWDATTLRRAVAMEANYTPGQIPQGDIGSAELQVKQMAADYMVPLTDDQAFWWGREIASGFKTPDAAKAMLTQLAIGRFPQLADLISKGVTPGNYFASYKTQIGQILEQPADAIDLTSPKWQQVTSFNDHGTIRPMTLSEAAQLARSQPEYKGTANGLSSAADTAEFIDKTFGRVA